MTDERTSRLLHRLRYETRDWCRAVRDEGTGRLTLHRASVQHTPEVWE